MIKNFDVDGINVILNKIEDDVSFSLAVYFKTGSKHEFKDERGISHLLEHMMFSGTNKRNSFEISEKMDFYGANMNAYTTKNITNYYFSSLTKYQEETFDIFFDMLSNPIFPEDQLIKEKEIVFEEINMDKDDIKVEIFEKVYEELIDGNLKNNILANKEEVNNINRDKLKEYYSKRYTKDNMGIIISGNIDEEILKKYIRKYFSKFKNESEKRTLTNSIIKKELLIKKDINQVNIYIISKAYNAINFRERIILLIIDYILGGGFSSRLFSNIREKEALSYSIYSYLEHNVDLDLHSIYIGTSKNKYEKALLLTKEVLKELKEKGINEREFEKAKNTILSNQVKIKENSKLVSKMLGMKILYNDIYENKYINEVIEDLKIDEVNNICKNIFDDYSIAIIGDINV